MKPWAEWALARRGADDENGLGRKDPSVLLSRQDGVLSSAVGAGVSSRLEGRSGVDTRYQSLSSLKIAQQKSGQTVGYRNPGFRSGVLLLTKSLERAGRADVLSPLFERDL